MDNSISVIGIGRVGLPLSLSFAEAGYKVFGIDVDEKLIETLLQSNMPFMEKNAQELLTKHINKNFIPTLNNSKIKDSKYIIVSLGTPVDEHLNPDYSQIDFIKKTIAENLQKNHVIILRSTVSPGTTEYLKDYLEKTTRLRCGKDFFLAFCPERIAEGNAIQEIKEIPQIIGGIDSGSSYEAEKLFKKITSECLISDAKSAELAKIYTNMYRYINFAIANEFAIVAMKYKKNIYEILRLANTNYKRGKIPQPGLTAGPCLFKDGFFLLNNIPFSELISTSWRINENLPIYLLEKVKEKTDLKNKKAVILGASFKRNIDDIRNSLSFKLKKALLREQCEVIMHDPNIEEYNLDLELVLDKADIVFIAMNHDEYKILNKEFLRKLVNPDCVVCDIWNMVNRGRIIYDLK